jgi:hypothetical protein
VGGENQNRFSAYISGSHILTLRLLDGNGDPYTLRAALGEGGIPVGQIIWLGCEYGYSAGHVVLRITVNSNNVAFTDDLTTAQVTRIPWYSNLKNQTGAIGLDVDNNNRGVFDLFSFAASDALLPLDPREHNMLVSQEQLQSKNTFLRFDGSRFVRADSSTHTGQISDANGWNYFSFTQP